MFRLDHKSRLSKFVVEKFAQESEIAACETHDALVRFGLCEKTAAAARKTPGHLDVVLLHCLFAVVVRRAGVLHVRGF
jgi:hypothetical protein